MEKDWPRVGAPSTAKKIEWVRSDTGKDNAHKEMMLTTDMCLAYKSNLKLRMCRMNDLGNDWYANHYDCQVNLYDTGTDLDPK